jgi:hypothetical protein
MAGAGVAKSCTRAPGSSRRFGPESPLWSPQNTPELTGSTFEVALVLRPRCAPRKLAAPRFQRGSNALRYTDTYEGVGSPGLLDLIRGCVRIRGGSPILPPRGPSPECNRARPFRDGPLERDCCGEAAYGRLTLVPSPELLMVKVPEAVEV